MNFALRERGGERKGPGASREGIRLPPASDRCQNEEILRFRFRRAQNEGENGMIMKKTATTILALLLAWQPVFAQTQAII
ncbi:MAG: hypothetical protein OXE54_08745, partial [Gammaproteobacteria bacterium]|nr:hypothetical protein [Gammaproteobacteria bacterium]MCY4297049.1 hypothetical protein [Gammaproteobacteria bacterium]